MHAVILVWIVWIAVVVGATAAALALVPRMSVPAPLVALRARVLPVVDVCVERLGRPGTALLIYLAGAAVVVAVGWPLGRLAHAVQGPVDEPAFRWFAHRQLADWTHVWRTLTKIGSPPVTQTVTGVAAIAFAVIWAVRRRPWAFPLVALPLGYCLEKYTQIILQTVVHRGHPPTTHGTYPSGGCGRVLVIYGMVIFLTVASFWPHRQRAWILGWGLLGCLISIQAYARIYNLEHWLTDVIGGIVFGLVLLAVMLSCLRVLSREGARETAHGPGRTDAPAHRRAGQTA